MRRLAMIALAAVVMSHPASAQGLERVTDRAAFAALIGGRDLTRFGIRLTVGDGTIAGRAFGAKVTGGWEWRDGFFCRTLTYGTRAFAPNCQVVLSDGATVRFVADRGTGDVADLTLQ